MKKIGFLAVVCFFVGAVTSGKLYENFKAYDLIATAESMDLLTAWQEFDGVDFWKFGAPGEESRVMIPPNLVKDFEKFLIREKIEYKIRSENVGEIEDNFEQEKVERMQRANLRKLSNINRPGFNVYWTSDEIDVYCQFLADTYPQRVTRERMVMSFEGREVFALKISKGGFGGKPIIFIDAGMHAREWVSQATMVYFLHRLVEDESVANELLENLDWIIIPNLNPDGYTWSYEQDRMWRKNRNIISPTCTGVDLNRNFAFNWRQAQTPLCTLTFPGPSGLSEVESRALNDYMTRYRPNVRLYMSVHSFGDMMLWPWGFSVVWITSLFTQHSLFNFRLFRDHQDLFRIGNFTKLLETCGLMQSELKLEKLIVSEILRNF